MYAAKAWAKHNAVFLFPNNMQCALFFKIFFLETEKKNRTNISFSETDLLPYIPLNFHKAESFVIPKVALSFTYFEM